MSFLGEPGQKKDGTCLDGFCSIYQGPSICPKGHLEHKKQLHQWAPHFPFSRWAFRSQTRKRCNIVQGYRAPSRSSSRFPLPGFCIDLWTFFFGLLFIIPKGDQRIFLWLKKMVPKWNPCKWKHGSKPAHPFLRPSESLHPSPRSRLLAGVVCYAQRRKLTAWCTRTRPSLPHMDALPDKSLPFLGVIGRE